MLKIEKQEDAEEDLEGIWLYSFEKWGEKQADHYYDELIKGMDLIANYPEIGVLVMILKMVTDASRSKSMKSIIKSRKPGS